MRVGCRDVKRAMLFAGVPFVSAFAGTLVAIAVALPTIVEAQETRLRADIWSLIGANDAERVRMTTAPGSQGTVSVLSADGVIRTQMATGGVTGAAGTNPIAAGFNLNAPDGVRIGRLGTAPLTESGEYGGVNLQLFDQAGKVRMRLIVDAAGDPAIEFLDADGAVTWSQR